MNKLLEQIENESDCSKKAEIFLKETGSVITWKLTGLSDRLGQGSKTLEYRFTLTRGDSKYSSLFNSSVNELEKATIKYGSIGAVLKSDVVPTNYDLLACLDTYTSRSDGLEDFMSNYGYESRLKASTAYKASVLQSEALRAMYNDDEIEALQAIN